MLTFPNLDQLLLKIILLQNLFIFISSANYMCELCRESCEADSCEALKCKACL